MSETGAPHRSSALHDIKDPGDLILVQETESLQAEDDVLEGIVWRKLDRWIIPLCAIFYLLAYLDRTNIGNARVAGMQKSLGLSNYQYTVALTVTYVPYLIAEFPSTLLLKFVGPNLMLPAMVTVWGVVSAAQGFIHNYSGLLACRFFLGAAEAGLFPGMVLYLSIFYPRRRLQVRIATFFMATSLAGAFSGLLAAAISQLNGKGSKPGWAWIFILEGAFSFAFGVTSFFLLPRSPETARFLTEKERAYVISTLKYSGSVSEDDDRDRFSWIEVVRAAKSPHVWFIAMSAPLGGAIVLCLAYFEPSIVASLGYAGTQAQLMSVPPFAVTFVLLFITAILSDRYQCRGYIVIVFSILQVIGFATFHASMSSHVRYGSLFLFVPGAFCAAPAGITWLANNSAPHVRRASALAACFTLSQVGGIAATWLLGALSPGPKFTAATLAFIVMSSVSVLLATANVIHLRRQNRLKAERRQWMKKEDEPESLGDRSAWFVYSL